MLMTKRLPQVPMIESDLETRNVDFQFERKASCANNSIKSFFSIFEENSLVIEDSVAKTAPLANLVDVLLSKPAGT